MLSMIWAIAYGLLWAETSLCLLCCLPFRAWRKLLMKITAGPVGAIISQICLVIAGFVAILFVENYLSLNYHEGEIMRHKARPLVAPAGDLTTLETAKRFRSQRNLYICFGHFVLLSCLSQFIRFNRLVHELEERVQTLEAGPITSTVADVTNTVTAKLSEGGQKLKEKAKEVASTAGEKLRNIDLPTADTAPKAELYVGGFANDTDEAELKSFLQGRAGGEKIDKVEIVRDAQQRPQGYAKVKLSSAASDALINEPRLEMNGRWIKLAQTSPEVPPAASKASMIKQQ